MTVVVDPGRHSRQSVLVSADRIALLVAIALVALVAVRWHDYQWDFYMFTGSATDFMNGVSPYRGEGLSFYHPPLTLYLYSLFDRLPFPIAYELWLFLKLVAFGGLLLVWKRHFLTLAFTWSTTLYFLLAYNGTIYSDLVSGNISVFEQLGLWLGFAALLKGRYAIFCVCVILVAQFKLTPMFFSVLLLLAPERPQWKWFAVCCAGFVAVFVLNFALQPALLRDFITVAPALDERGTLAPGTLAFLRDFFDQLGGPRFFDATRAADVTFLIAALAVGVASLLAVVRYRTTGRGPDPKLIVYFACLAYALMTPRMRAYSYILLLVPTLHLLRTLPRRNLVPVVFAVLAAMVVFPHGNSLLPFRSLSQLLYEYLPLAAAFGVWLVFASVLRQTQAQDSEADWVPGT